MNPLLLVMNPRRIPEALDALNALEIDQCWMSNYWEKELEPVVKRIVYSTVYTHFLMISDDGTPTQQALDLVLRHLASGDHPVVTAYCNNDAESPHVNLTRSPFRRHDVSVPSDHDWYTRAEVESWPDDLVPSFFTGMCLTAMSREMWIKFPFHAVTREGEPRGYQSDWSLSTRLQRAKVPIVAPRGAFVRHLKQPAGQPVPDTHHLWCGVAPKDTSFRMNARRRSA